MQGTDRKHRREGRLRSVLLLVAVFLLSAADRRVCLTTAEEHLATLIGFETEVLLIAKDESAGPLHRLSGYDENGYQIMANGVVISVPRVRSDQVLWSLRDRLKPRKYMAFVVESSDALKTDRIGIIKGTDQYDIIRLMHTNGDDDDVNHEDVLAKLKGWEKRSPFEIIGAENDWVEIEFRIMPRDLKAFAEDVYEFSPAAVDDGAGSIAELVKEISATHRLLIWWE